MQEPVGKPSIQYLVLGLGGIGRAAAYWLARQAGADVLGLEQFPLGHVRGGSQDHSRIIRLSYHNTTYVKLAQAAYRAWTAVEADALVPTPEPIPAAMRWTRLAGYKKKDSADLLD